MSFKNPKGKTITRIAENSIAAELEIQEGSKLLSINGIVINDIFDYRFAVRDEYTEVLTESPDGSHFVYEIEKDYYEDLGFEFDTRFALMDKPKSCRNKCIFCFIDQLPKGLRDTLYFKDDDSRLSFLTGNYVTLTNMTDAELDRIIYYRLSPVNISVHTADPKLRCEMLRNPGAGGILKIIERFAAAGLEMNFQIVLCKGVNDGDYLTGTVNALAAYIPFAVSLSVVPAGLSGFREGLHPLEPYTPRECAGIINLIHKFQRQFLKSRQTRFVYAADEFYAKAGLKFLPYKAYGDFPQLENGVGMAAQTMRTLALSIKRRARCDGIKKSAEIVTGECAYDLMLACCGMITDKFPNVSLRVNKIKNRFFGGEITVSGLLTGRDIIEGLDGMNLGQIIIIPKNVLRAGEDILLDGTAAGDMEKSLNRPVFFCGNDDLLDTILG